MNFNPNPQLIYVPHQCQALPVCIASVPDRAAPENSQWSISSTHWIKHCVSNATAMSDYRLVLWMTPVKRTPPLVIYLCTAILLPIFPSHCIARHASCTVTTIQVYLNVLQVQMSSMKHQPIWLWARELSGCQIHHSPLNALCDLFFHLKYWPMTPWPSALSAVLLSTR